MRNLEQQEATQAQEEDAEINFESKYQKIEQLRKSFEGNQMIKKYLS